jgi:hypothetical protein
MNLMWSRVKSWYRSGGDARRNAVAAGATLLMVGVIMMGVFGSSDRTEPPITPLVPPTRSASERTWEKVAPRLEQSKGDSRAAITRRLKQVTSYFDERKSGARPFAQAVLGVDGKIQAVDTLVSRATSAISDFFWPQKDDPDDFFQALKDTIPDRFTLFVNERFRQQVIDPFQIRAVVKDAIAGYVGDVEQIENRLLVDIRADLADTDDAAETLPGLQPVDVLHDRYETLLREVVGVAATDLNVTTATQVVSWVGGDIATAVSMSVASSLASELGLSAGVGAASSLTTLGAGLVVGWMVDQIIEATLKQAGYDPEGEIVSKIEAALDQAGRMTGEAMKNELDKLHERRSRLREAAIRKLFLEGGAH